jgi:hypothetical protein
MEMDMVTEGLREVGGDKSDDDAQVISTGIGPCFPLAGGLCKFYANTAGKRPIHRQPLLMQYKQQANPLLLTHNYTTLVISRNHKKKQPTQNWH